MPRSIPRSHADKITNPFSDYKSNFPKFRNVILHIGLFDRKIVIK